MLSPKGRNKRIIFIVPYPIGISPGQRFRFEQYLTILKKKGFQIEIHPFLKEAVNLFHSSINPIQRIWVITHGFLMRFLLLFRIQRFEFVFLFREFSPMGPPFFEWIVAKIIKSKIIYDFDDAIWTTDNMLESQFERFLRWRSKISLICNWSYRVSCGNEYLCTYARQFNKQVVLNPTTIDTESLHIPSQFSKANSMKVTIGWTGSHSTLKYLVALETVLEEIEKKFENVHFIVICDIPPKWKITRMEFLPWRKDTESFDLARIDIGIMPLPDDEWAKGKCGFKALQYLAMEIPTVVSPTAVNSKIVKHNQSGFLAETPDQWMSYLTVLIKNPELRAKFGKIGRQDVINNYSSTSNESNFLSLFE